jgi:hypothetical protein
MIPLGIFMQNKASTPKPNVLKGGSQMNITGKYKRVIEGNTIRKKRIH